MKKFLSLALSAALLCMLGAPAFAAEAPGVDARLTAVTEKVKATLDLDTAAYDSFHGEVREGTLTPVWDLRWSGEGGDLAVSATEGGKILGYYLSDGGSEYAVSNRRSFGPAFPKLTRAEAQKTAQAFLDKVLDGAVERAAFGEEAVGGLSVTNHNFYGEVLENGLPSPFGFRVSVRVRDNAVTSFSYNGGVEDYMGGLPAAVPAADAGKAGDSLKSTQALRLEYVLDEDGKTAVLRYLPEDTHSFYVDAKDGALVDLTALEQAVWDRGTGGVMEAPGAAPSFDSANKETALTEAELAGVALLEGAMSKEALDAAARSISALGLSKYTLANLHYRVDKESGDVTAALQYAYQRGDDICRRNATLDAKTGALLSLYSARPWKEGEKPAISEAAALVKAQAFLKEICPEQFAKTARVGEGDGADGRTVYSFRFAAKENGYFLPESVISVSVDGADGGVYAYDNRYVDGVNFQRPEGIVDMDAARAAWFETYDVTLGYLAVPEKLDLSEPEFKPFIEMGRKYLYTQKPGWALTREDWYLGVDAKTGEAVKGEQGAERAVAYDDLARHWVKAQAEALAEYGVGWLGGSMDPARALSQLDLVALLVSTDGYRYDPNEENAADRLYEIAYSMGILEKADRNDGDGVTRAALVKLLLDGAGYGNIAPLEGIFKCDFADEGSIAPEYYGYAAVAQALGLARGDKAGNFAPERTATRAEAASMLYQFMSR